MRKGRIIKHNGQYYHITEYKWDSDLGKSVLIENDADALQALKNNKAYVAHMFLEDQIPGGQKAVDKYNKLAGNFPVGTGPTKPPVVIDKSNVDVFENLSYDGNITKYVRTLNGTVPVRNKDDLHYAGLSAEKSPLGESNIYPSSFLLSTLQDIGDINKITDFDKARVTLGYAHPAAASYSQIRKAMGLTSVDKNGYGRFDMTNNDPTHYWASKHSDKDHKTYVEGLNNYITKAYEILKQPLVNQPKYSDASRTPKDKKHFVMTILAQTLYEYGYTNPSSGKKTSNMYSDEEIELLIKRNYPGLMHFADQMDTGLKNMGIPGGFNEYLALPEEQKQPYKKELIKATRYPALSNPASHELYGEMDKKMANLLPPGQVEAEERIRQDFTELNPEALLQNKFYKPAEEKKTDNNIVVPYLED
jgi:hypothetical protein